MTGRSPAWGGAPAPASPGDAGGAWTTQEVWPAVVMAAGWAWNGGTYPWVDGLTGQIAVTVAHLVPVLLIVVAVAGLLSGRRPGASRVTLTALAVAAKVFTVVAAVWAATHPGGFGPHTFLDFVPIGLVNLGGGLWFLALVRRGRAARQDHGPAELLRLEVIPETGVERARAGGGGRP